MIKEIVISSYLFLTKIVFNIFLFFPLKNKTVFLSSFGHNALFTANELAKKNDAYLIFINEKSCKLDFSQVPVSKKKFFAFHSLDLWQTLCSYYHLATAKYVFVDNYFPVLAVFDFKKEVKCIQLWHAAGAIKKFGWGDPETSQRSEQAKIRFQKVYNTFQYIPVGSEQMAEIFQEAFHLEIDRFLYTGVPQTDFYFDTESKRTALINVEKKYPIIKGKKVILYAPTFRKGDFDATELQLDISQVIQKLDNSFVLFIRLHPAVRAAANKIKHPRVLTVSDYPQISDLLIASDILITDYSSIPFEFAFLKKKMIFFTYDLESYNKTQGLWQENSLFFPGPIAKTNAEVIEHILDSDIDYKKIENFVNHWNSCSRGQSSHNLVSAIYSQDETDSYKQ